MKLLLLSYECSPYRGSEWAAGWGRLLGAAKAGETHVITSEANYPALQQAKAEGLMPDNVRFYTPEPDARLRKLERKPAVFAYNYTAYRHWHRLAFELSKELHAREHFDVVHQVTVCTFREPGFGWMLGVPFVWGPMGGTQNFPTRFLHTLSAKEAGKEAVRSATNWCALRKPRVRRAARQTSVIIGANSTNKRDLLKALGGKVELLLETGLHSVPDPDSSRFEQRLAAERHGRPQAPLRLLWSGEFQSRKALPVLLRALALMPQEVAWCLDVLGDGPLRTRWEKEAAALGLGDRVHFHGRLPFQEAVDKMRSAELFCFTSLRDTSGNVVLEALAAGVPVLCFDHQGAGDIVNEFSGVKFAVGTPREAYRDWSETITRLATDARKLYALSRGATRRARRYLWTDNHDFVNGIYRQLANEQNARIGARGKVAATAELFEMPVPAAQGHHR